MKTKKNTLKNNKKKVLVGISGGVDSSVSALLLIEQGYEVEGVFAKVWQPDFVECTWRDEMKDAMRVCAQLKIPFHFLDLESQYKKNVADYMINEYQNNRTPNPDVMCNTHIKFGFIYDYAMKKGFDYVATGHYVQNINGVLTRGTDSQKDQSYFLWNVETSKFKHILFPIGHLEKKEVRMIAQRNNLCTATKKDSQGLCFIGPVDMKTFLKKLISTKPGKVINIEGVEIGAHEGVELYTVGERHGFTIDAKHKTNNNTPLFVIDKQTDSNKLVVSNEPPLIKEVFLSDCIFHQKDFVNQKVEVQFRYRQIPCIGKLVYQDDMYRIIFNENKPTLVASGQSAVMYNGNACIGGAIVEKMIY